MCDTLVTSACTSTGDCSSVHYRRKLYMYNQAHYNPMLRFLSAVILHGLLFGFVASSSPVVLAVKSDLHALAPSFGSCHLGSTVTLPLPRLHRPHIHALTFLHVAKHTGLCAVIPMHKVTLLFTFNRHTPFHRCKHTKRQAESWAHLNLSKELGVVGVPRKRWGCRCDAAPRLIGVLAVFKHTPPLCFQMGHKLRKKAAQVLDVREACTSPKQMVKARLRMHRHAACC